MHRSKGKDKKTHNRHQRSVSASLLHQQGSERSVNNPLHHVGAAIQHQFRGLRKRHISHVPVHAIVNTEDDDRLESDFDQWSFCSENTATTSITSFSILHANEGEKEQKLTPKKLDKSPLPKNTTKIALFTSSSDNTNYSSLAADSLPEAFYLWMDATKQLLRSPEMSDVLSSSYAVYYHVVRTVTLPIRLPIHIGFTTMHMILSISTGIVQRAASILLTDGSQQQQQGSEEDRNRGLIQSVLSLPGTIICVAGNIVVSVVAPVLGVQKQQLKGVSSSPECKTKEKNCLITPSPQRRPLSYPDYLDRLRLDYIPNDVSFLVEKDFAGEKAPVAIVKEESSNFLLRVNDLSLRRAQDCSSLYYIDLHTRNVDQLLVAQALSQMVACTIGMMANHSVCSLGYPEYLTTPESAIQWQPEGSTKRILRNMDQRAEAERLQLLQKEIFIWSGRFQHDTDGYGRKHGFFLARGAVRMAPTDFMKLLWDNRRTSEYNNFCMGRSTLHCVGDVDEHAILQGTAVSATKIVKSKMRVPFAGITVKAVCIMHVRPLPDGGGFVVVSRTLDSGPVGTHTAPVSSSKTTKNEILWGCNVIRSVPGQPGVTELTTLSQVGSSVPSFLAQKIGLMGITEFFKNVRAVAPTSNEQ